MKIIFCSFFLILFSTANSQVIHTLQAERFVHYLPDDWVTYAPANEITSIDVGDENIYFGSRNGGILRYRFYDKSWDYPLTTSNGLRSNHIIKIVYDPDSRRLFARTDKGVDVYRTGFGYFEHLSPRTRLPQQQRPSDDEIKEFRSSHSYRYPEFYRPLNRELPDFFTNRDYLFRAPDEILDPYNRIFHINGDRVADRFGNLWLATDGLGVAFAEAGSWTLKLSPHSIPAIAPRDLFLDRTGIWIGGLRLDSEPNGITFWDDSLNIWHYYESRFNSDIYSDQVFCMAGNASYVFFGTDMGLVRYEKENKTWNALQSFNRLRSAHINDLKIIHKKLYIATERGLYWMFPSSAHIERIKDARLNTTAVSKIASWNNKILLSTPFGLYTLNPETERLSFWEIRSALPEYGFSCVGANRGDIWLAGENGVTFFDGKTKSWTSFTQLRFQLNADYYDIAFTNDGTAWFATSKGLLKYDSQRGFWYRYTTSDGLASNAVFHIDVAGDYLWLSTRAGVTIFRWYRDGRRE